MKDRTFFPLAFLLSISMIGASVAPALGRLPEPPFAGDGENYAQVTIAGDYLNTVEAGGDAIVQLTRGAQGQRLVYIEAKPDVLRSEAEAGPHFSLAADLEQQFSGMRMRCTVRVKPAEVRGAMRVALNYSAGRSGESGWQEFDLMPHFTDVSFEFDVPVHRGDQGLDYLGIRPVLETKPRALLVERITFERLGRTPNS